MPIQADPNNILPCDRDAQPAGNGAMNRDEEPVILRSDRENKQKAHASGVQWYERVPPTARPALG